MRYRAALHAEQAAKIQILPLLASRPIREERWKLHREIGGVILQLRIFVVFKETFSGMIVPLHNMIASFALALLFFAGLPLGLSAADRCGETLLLDGAEELHSWGMDTTSHWWAVTKPFSGQTRLYVDDWRSPIFQEVVRPTFSPTGEGWAAFALTQSGQWSVVGPGVETLLNATEVVDIVYGRNGAPAYLYKQGSNEILNFMGKEYPIFQRVGRIALDCNGLTPTYAAARAGGKSVVTPTWESAIFDDVKLFGVWENGKPIYAGKNGAQWKVYIGSKPQSRMYDNITEYTLNQYCTAAAFVGVQGRSYNAGLISAEYEEIIESRAYDAIDGLALHPTSEVFSFRARNQMGVEKIVFSSTEYAAGREASRPFFTYNGDELIYVNADVDVGVSINGKRYVVQRAIDVNGKYAVQPRSGTVAFATTTGLAALDLAKGTVYAGMMMEEVGEPRYNRIARRYEALGRVNKRLYLQFCTTR